MLTLDRRPKSFEQIVGHPGIISEMKTRSLTRNFPQIMVFEGPTGTGKTTMAYLIAALINDPDPVESDDCFNPNMESASTKSIYNETFNRDTWFLDASSMGKADVLELQRRLQSSPLHDRNRVVIIDEAQELSKAGKGATLKLLEIVNPSTYIIMCTMDSKALSTAVKSRGSLYKFHPLKKDFIAKALFENFIEPENMDVPDEFITEGLFIIAENAEGSMRLALQIFERCITGEFFSSQAILDEFGFVKEDTVVTWILAILAGKQWPDNVVENLQDFYYKGMAVLTSAVQLSFIPDAIPDWKKGTAQKISRHANFKQLLDIFTEIDVRCQSYFKPTVFWSEISKFETVPKLTEPVRRKKVT